ncbi:Elongation factor 1-beta 1 [Capsicum annuum]|uniref:Elongation factor 1-beta 1 n=1 Tax=Capsicum annuum TaxID=4072 RepID=A0A2G2XZ58_CAPAN|nr:Elongation factor 1-beta 1 [Capsicum annuum]KAF3655964.1 Elongation factor 1-beta 1 [Capsicum annuum]PHT62768.1 Elongation factor 1-beta 1 [Capsicum annuum]
MVVAFSNLHTESGLKFVNDHLLEKTYISGDQLTKNDIKGYGAILEKPSLDLYPNAIKCQAVLATAAPAKEDVNPTDDNNEMMTSISLKKRQRKKKGNKSKGG